jgi:ATP-dependent RNA helicase RhlB
MIPTDDSSPHTKEKRFLSRILEWFSPAQSERVAEGTFRAVTGSALPDAKHFAEFGLSDPVRQGIEDAGFVRCTPVQELSLPITLAGRDVAAQAQTGTGKTAAFLVTIFERLLNMEKRKPDVPACLILAPTRELALQIYQDGQILGAHTGLKMVAVFGGIGYEEQARQLHDGVDIVIATPGRLIDYMKKKSFLPQLIRILVVDEADRMFDMGFIKDLRYILRRLPPYHRRQSMLFSATLSSRVLELTYEHMNLPKEIYVTPEEVTVDSVEQSVLHVAGHEKLSLLLGVLEREDWQRVLIFANTKVSVDWLYNKLRGNGYPAQGLSGDLSQKHRLRLLSLFKSGDLQILVATDVASRGLHVDGITHVINYDLPQDPEDYVHRIGRTARAGSPGKAISLACEHYVYSLEAIEEFIGDKIPVVWPEDSWLLPDRAKPTRRSRPRKRRTPQKTTKVRSASPRRQPGSKSEGKRSAGDSSAEKSSRVGKGRRSHSKRKRRRRRRDSSSESKAGTSPR